MLEEMKLYQKLKEKIMGDESLLRLAKRIYRKETNDDFKE